MGYETTYDLEWNGGSSGFAMQDAIAVLGNGLNKWDMDRDDFERILEHGTPVKWYEFKEDMTRLSLAYPKMIFVLHRSGEENGDMTREYFRNGQHRQVKARIEWDAPPPF